MNKAETKTFLELLAEMPEHRKGNAIRHKLEDILTIGILCILCNGETFVGMQLFGETHEEELRQYLELPHGIPSHDVFGDVFSRLDTAALERCFECWLGGFSERVKSPQIAVDGKSIRASRSSAHKAKHIVTAYSSDLQLVLGQQVTDEKSNEITAIPLLLKALDIQGSTISIDAMGTQTEIAKQIVEAKADYVLALKDNHPTFKTDVALFFEQEVLPCKTAELEQAGLYAQTLEKDHGRIETRMSYVLRNIDWLEGREQWAGLGGLGLIRTKREVLGQGTTYSQRLYLFSSSDMTAQMLLKVSRNHWAIENQLHWMLDVCFHEDNARARIGNAAVVLNILRKCALQMLKADSFVKESMISKRLRCAWDFQYALRVIRNAHAS